MINLKTTTRKAREHDIGTRYHAVHDSLDVENRTRFENVKDRCIDAHDTADVDDDERAALNDQLDAIVRAWEARDAITCSQVKAAFKAWGFDPHENDEGINAIGGGTSRKVLIVVWWDDNAGLEDEGWCGRYTVATVGGVYGDVVDELSEGIDTRANLDNFLRSARSSSSST